MAEGREEVSSAIADLGDGAYALRIVTEANVRRLGSIVSGFAETHFDHRPVTLTCATKSNILGGTDGLFDAVLEDAVADSGVVEFEHLHVDNAGAQMVGDPRRFDLVVTTNAPGDILSDVGVATVGGLGLAPSGVFGEDVAYFEPVHGTAPDIAGQGIINPTATILSAVMMLRYLGFADAANRLEGAVETVYAEGAVLTPDQGGSASTTEMVEAIEGHL
jgi:isocitrate/isopropylmalate dehydrogenase